MSDKEILYYLQEDASQGIQMAIDQYGNAVKTICNAILAGYGKPDIEEVISDVFVGLWKSRDRIRLSHENSLRSYLYGIARITALDKKRELAKGKTMEDIEEIPDMASMQDVEQEAIQNTDYAVLRQLIFDLDSPDKEIFVYRYFQNLSVKEIAQRLQIKTKAVENRLARGKKKLKKQLIHSGIEVA